MVKKFKEFWGAFVGILVRILVNNSEKSREPFEHFFGGTSKETVWEWFDDVSPKGIIQDFMPAFQKHGFRVDKKDGP